MPFLYLVRHPETQPDPDVPASEWQLTETGLAQVEALAHAPFWPGLDTIYTSTQYKTAVVGERMSVLYGIPLVQVEDLGEARRDEWLGLDAFPAAQAAFFARPNEPPVPSWESADEALARFRAAVNAVLAQHDRQASLAIVTHATVLTLYIAHLRDEAPSFDAWSRVGFAEVMAVERGSMYPMTPFRAAPYDGLPLP